MIHVNSPHHVTPVPQEVRGSMHHHEMWQNNDHHFCHDYGPREVPTLYRTSPPHPLRRMSPLSNFSDKSVTNSRTSAPGTSFEDAINAINAEVQDADINFTNASKAPSVEDALSDAEQGV